MEITAASKKGTARAIHCWSAPTASQATGIGSDRLVGHGRMATAAANGGIQRIGRRQQRAGPAGHLSALHGRPDVQREAGVGPRIVEQPVFRS
jgi:hypothetical protein